MTEDFEDFDATPGSLGTDSGRKVAPRAIEDRRNEPAAQTSSPRVYLMTGSQKLQLPGKTVMPGCGEFTAVLSPENEEFLIRIGAIQKVGG